jgi:hypothetical protein
LAYQRIEALRGVGRHIANGVPGALPTVEAILRATTELKKGAEMEKVNRPPPPHLCFVRSCDLLLSSPAHPAVAM